MQTDPVDRVDFLTKVLELAPYSEELLKLLQNYSSQLVFSFLYSNRSHENSLSIGSSVFIGFSKIQQSVLNSLQELKEQHSRYVDE